MEKLEHLDFSSKSVLAEPNNDDSYNPFLDRHVKKPVSSFGSFLNLLKSSLGTGILALPLAFSNAGLVFGAVATILVGLLYGHCVHILVVSSQKLCKKTKTPMLDFPETAEKAFESGPPWMQRQSKVAKAIVEYGLITTAFDGSVYIVFAATTFQKIFLTNFETDWSIRIFILIVAIPVLFITQVRYLKFLAPVSAAANVIILTVLVIVFYYIFSTPLDFGNKPLIVSFREWPTYFSIVAYAIGGIGIVMPVENDMKRPQDFTGCPSILNFSMATLIFLYTNMGLFGYVRYGEEIEGSITLNLPQDDALSITAQSLMSVALLLSIGIVFQSFMGVLWKKIVHWFPDDRHNAGKMGVRFLATVIITGLAVAIPDLGVFVALMGSFVYSTLSFLFPSIIQTAYLYPNYGKFNWLLWKNILIMIFAVFVIVIGVYFSIIDIIDLY